MPKYPNRDALRQANDIYLDAMRPFIIRLLNQVPGETAEDLIQDALMSEQQNAFWQKLDETGDIEAAIDFNYFPQIVRRNWDCGFAEQFNNDLTVQSMLWLIRKGRNSCEHRGTTDIDYEFVRTNLFLITEVLGKINRPNEQREVKVIRDDLFSDDTAERLAEAAERLKDVETENAGYKKSLAEVEKHLETAKLEKSKYEEDSATLSKQVDEKEKLRKKLSKQLKSARAETDKYKKNLSNTKKRLEKSEAAHTGDKERLETQSNELKDTKDELTAVKAERTVDKKHLKTISKELKSMKAEWDASETRLTAASNQLASVQAKKNASERYLAVTRNLLTTVGISDQSVFPPLETDSVVRILDRRGTDKGAYLARLLDQKQPAILYVQSEDKIHQLLDLVGPEKAVVIGKHSEQTSETEETEILKRLENGELIAVVSNTTLSTLASSHCVEHFVLCHLVPSVDEFYKRCEPVFASAKNVYLHLIYESKQDIEEISKRYLDEPALRKLYEGFIDCTLTIDTSVNLEHLYSELCKKSELKHLVRLGIETGFSIFEELGFLKQNEEGIQRLSTPRRELKESEIYCRGEKLKKEIANSPAFQYNQSVEQIGEEIFKRLNVGSEQILCESSIHKMPVRVSETEGDYLKDVQTQPEQSTEVVEKDSVGFQTTKNKTRKKKSSIAERYTSETTEADRDAVAMKVVEIRINAAGSKPISWKTIREKLGIREDEFHKVIRPSKGYRKAVIDRIKQLKSRPEGWEYSGKLEVLTGIKLSESELS